MGVNNSTITITEQVLLEQARKYDKTLRTLPMIAMQDTLQYVTVVPNVQGDLVLSLLKARSRWAPYRNNDDQNTKISIDPRILTTRLCSLEVKFDPNKVAGKLYQQRPNTGDALKDAVDLLYAQALVAEGSPVPDPARFGNLLTNLMLGK